ncbi:zinc finger protein 281-like [Sphaeramia orbicularis]|uniref:zinc finger protein 281-like n=1 Tax=Sphaeramia orbicularis TaxID=375764 RepID=UPI00117FD0B6|nr:zinc finger protein 281-like [Sphaeramia orbicularis]
MEAEEEGGDSSAQMETPAEQEVKSKEPKEESVADEEQEADHHHHHHHHQEETDADGDGRSQRPDGTTNKKLSLFRRLSFSRSKQSNHRDQDLAEGGGSVHREPPGYPGNGEPNQTNRTGSGERTSRSNACLVL